MADGPLRKVIRHIHQLVGATPADALTDRQLLERFAQRRDEGAFAALVERHGPLVLGVCRRVLRHQQDAEDAFQATFHVLARRAGSVGWHESVANWLYEVALRVARKARVNAARRQLHERHVENVEPAATAQDAWHELKPLLDEELARLPRKFREPLVLCYLEGKTRDEAAQDLGWSLGTVKGRLERGRDMLRDRLVKRGLSLSAAIFGVMLSESTASAAPATLVTATVGAITSGAASPAVAALAQDAVRAFAWTRVKVTAAGLLAVGLIGSAIALVVIHQNRQTTSTVQTSPAINDVARPAELPENLRGQKVLVAFDPASKAHGDEALKKAGAQIVEAVTANLFLIDTKGRKPADVLRDAPHHQGALVFQDGQFREALPYENLHHKGVLLSPEPLVRVNYPTHDGIGIVRVQRAIQEFAAQDVLVERKTDTASDALTLTPGKSKTLLEVFLLAKPGFHYVQKKLPE